MINKNVADYTNFDGKTNKKIVQAPGGQSSFSIGWSNDKIDYGPERNIKKKGNYNQSNEQLQMNSGQNYQKPHQEPISTKGNNQHSFDYLQEHKKADLGKPPINNNNGQKASIKIIEQKSNNIFGENNYNYWNEQKKGTQQSNSRSKVNTPQQPQQQQYQQNQQKTSVKVHNPPGGKSNFTFG